MKVQSVKTITSNQPRTVVDCYVNKGYLQGPGGSLPDVDIDYESTRRQDIKEYIERRYNHNGKQRVFSAGTMTTLKMKAVIKDVARTMRIPVQLVNYFTAIIEDDACDYTGIFKLGFENKRIAKFIHDYPQLFENIRTLMFQPRSSSIHASALLVTPDQKDGEEMECFDFTPIKKVDGLLVSEFDGYQLDESGLLKNDCLATKELSKLHSTMDLCNSVYGTHLTLEEIATGNLDDAKVYELLSNGYTQNVFQFASKGMTKFLMDMKPNCIDDLIAANALYRPATLENGSTESYVDCKNGLVEPTYMWGTYDILKNTYGLITYQEQVVFIARKVGGFSLGDGVQLVKYISKKKTEKIQAMKGKFMEGAAKNNCPKEEATAIWDQVEACGSYLFNRSHATAYAITSYVGAYLKANYPTAFYTVALEWANDDELPIIITEMESCSNAKIVAPDINKSGEKFYTDFETDSIFWSLNRIKQVGVKAVDWIVEERSKRGNFSGIDDFIDRVFRYKLKKYKYFDDPDNEEETKKCPVNARHVLHLILAGCFDKSENVKANVERYDIIKKAAAKLGFELKAKDFPEDLVDKHYFWSCKQLEVAGIGSIDYRRIYDNSQIKPQLKGRVSYVSLKDLMLDSSDGKRAGICATIVEIEEKKYVSKKTGETETYCKLLLQQNNDVCEAVCWAEEYARLRGQLINSKNKLIVCSGVIKYSDYAKSNNFQFTKSSIIDII